MLMLSPAVSRLIQRAMFLALLCSDPTTLRNNLRTLQDQLTLTAQTLAVSEMSIAQDAAVPLEVQLVPFLRDADAFFRFARERIPQLRELVRASMALIGSSTPAPPAGQSLFQCQNAARIWTNLNQMDQRLAALDQSLRQWEATYAADATRIAEGIRRRFTPPIIPIEMNPNALPRRQSVAEQTALMAVRQARQEVAAFAMLVQAALGEIVLSGPVQMIPF